MTKKDKSRKPLPLPPDNVSDSTPSKGATGDAPPKRPRSSPESSLPAGKLANVQRTPPGSLAPVVPQPGWPPLVGMLPQDQFSTIMAELKTINTQLSDFQARQIVVETTVEDHSKQLTEHAGKQSDLQLQVNLVTQQLRRLTRRVRIDEHEVTKSQIIVSGPFKGSGALSEVIDFFTAALDNTQAKYQDRLAIRIKSSYFLGQGKKGIRRALTTFESIEVKEEWVSHARSKLISLDKGDNLKMFRLLKVFPKSMEDDVMRAEESARKWKAFQLDDGNKGAIYIIETAYERSVGVDIVVKTKLDRNSKYERYSVNRHIRWNKTVEPA